jgi:hypothetical protein
MTMVRSDTQAGMVRAREQTPRTILCSSEGLQINAFQSGSRIDMDAPNSTTARFDR